MNGVMTLDDVLQLYNTFGIFMLVLDNDSINASNGLIPNILGFQASRASHDPVGVSRIDNNDSFDRASCRSCASRRRSCVTESAENRNIERPRC